MIKLDADATGIASITYDGLESETDRLQDSQRFVLAECEAAVGTVFCVGLYLMVATVYP